MPLIILGATAIGSAGAALATGPVRAVGAAAGPGALVRTAGVSTRTAAASTGLASAATRIDTLVLIAAALLFILALAGLSKQTTALRGNTLGIVGMTAALIGTIFLALTLDSGNRVLSAALIALALIIGAAIGITWARRVEMTGMPELIAMLHSFVGLAAVLVGFNSFLTTPGAATETNAFHMGEVGLAVLIGAYTFTGSIVAYLKLSGRISGKPRALPGHNWVNLGLAVLAIAFIVVFGHTTGVRGGIGYLVIVAVAALALGINHIMAIGGGDMPVVVSMLNSYSGWAAAMAGFTLGNDLLIITGALVGSSGAYLSYVMCQAMNRSFVSVVLGGLGSGGGAPAAGGSGVAGEHTETTPDAVAAALWQAKRVIIAPGYGMAVAKAQFPVATLAERLRAHGVDVKFGIHPVAGRLPGHMNVLLAEAKVPYNIVLDLDEINDQFKDADVALVIGANDTVNPSAEDPGSPIAGMPVLKVWEAATCVVFKRSMSHAGYAGVQNPLFFKENTDMLLGDAKASVDAILAALPTK